MISSNINILVYNFTVILPIIILSCTIHEFAHAYISYKLGDYSQKTEGRLTLNPLKHIDPVGLLFIIITGYGWAKPVMVRPNLYQNPKDIIKVALAGPISNLLLAAIAIIICLFTNGITNHIFTTVWQANILLAIFNMIPIPPFDGSKLWLLFLKEEEYKSFESNKMLSIIAIIIIIYTNLISIIGLPIINFITTLIKNFRT